MEKRVRRKSEVGGEERRGEERTIDEGSGGGGRTNKPHGKKPRVVGSENRRRSADDPVDTT